jgi:hypothetical protein
MYSNHVQESCLHLNAFIFRTSSRAGLGKYPGRVPAEYLHPTGRRGAIGPSPAASRKPRVSRSMTTSATPPDAIVAVSTAASCGAVAMSSSPDRWTTCTPSAVAVTEIASQFAAYITTSNMLVVDEP